MKSTYKRRLGWLTGSLAALIAVSLVVWGVRQYQAAAPAQNQKIQIVASINVWGDIASQIGGDKVAVSSILTDPESDPHLFEADAKTASQIATADLVIDNGLGYDEFMNKLTTASPSDQRQELTISVVLQANGNANPHLWYDLPRIPRVAQAIADKLASIDPVNAGLYQQNLKSFNASYSPVLSKLSQLKRAYAGKSGAYTERVAEYVLTAADINNLTPVSFASAVESGSEPSPQDIEKFLAIIKNRQISLLQYNTQSVNDVTKQILNEAKTANIKVVGVSETLPPGQDFQTWQLSQLESYL